MYDDPCPLVVALEDDPASARGLRMLLSAAGYAAIVGRSLDAVLARDPAIEATIAIIADLDLGDGLSGVDEALRLRRMLGRDIPLLLISESIRAPSASVLVTPIIKLLDKPIAPDQLTSWLDAVRT